MIIIEFCGTPGCGKSTLCKSIACKLKEAGIDSECREEWLKRVQQSTVLKIRRRIYCFFIKFKRKYPLMVKKASNGIEKNTDKWTNMIAQDEYFIASSQRREIVLFDEGLIQCVTSVSHGKEINSELLDAACRAQREIIQGPYLVFHCVLDTSENIQRIRNRNLNGRFFKFSDEELPGQLQLKERNIDKVLQAFSGCRSVRLDVSDFDRALSEAMQEILAFYNNNKAKENL